MIDRRVHHAEAVSTKGDSCRLKYRDLGKVSTDDSAWGSIASCRGENRTQPGTVRPTR